jgi:ABC-type transport system involved in cytochrome c biogenesis permease subunit
LAALAVCALLSQWFGTSGPTQRHALLRSIFHFASVSAILSGIGILLGAFWAKDHMGRYWDWDLKKQVVFSCLVGPPFSRPSNG